jgi:hypothetical protein
MSPCDESSSRRKKCEAERMDKVARTGTGVWTSRMKDPGQSNEEKTSSKCVRKGLVELSTMFNGSTSGSWGIAISPFNLL